MDTGALTTLVRDQRRWSLTANALKASIERTRWTILGLAVAGAILETGGAQIHVMHPEWAMIFGYLGAAVLAVAAVIRQAKLGHERMQAWTIARAGSESLKREMYLFTAAARPYSSGNAALTLLDRKEQILAKLQPCQKFRVEPKGELDSFEPLDISTYLEKRISGEDGQIKYFTDRADRYAGKQEFLNNLELALAIVAALLGAAVTMTGKQAYGAWVAVITTITGAIAAHALAQRYEQLIIAFRATADRLAVAKDRWSATGGTSLADLVEACEAVLFEENQGWIAGADESTVRVRDSVALPSPPALP